VYLHDVLAVAECAFLLREVVVVVPMQRLAEEILCPVNIEWTVSEREEDLPDNADDASLLHSQETHHQTPH